LSIIQRHRNDFRRVAQAHGEQAFAEAAAHDHGGAALPVKAARIFREKALVRREQAADEGQPDLPAVRVAAQRQIDPARAVEREQLRPELFALYRACGVDLALCGHAHGGQIRLPLVGGLFAPHQGFFPKYTSGLYREGGSAMVVSRGLGESLFPVRLGNPPEVVTVTLDN